MKTLLEHVERVRAQPHHIRKQVAFAAAAAGAIFIALVWFAGSLATGTFSIANGNSFATEVPQQGASADDSATNQGLAGAGAASALPQSNAPARIEIIDATPPATSQKQAEQTTIPF